MGERMRSGGVIALPSEVYEDSNGRGTMYQWDIEVTKDGTNFEPFDKSEMVAAHPSLPFGSRALVTNLRNGLSQEVRIIDRGPTREHRARGVIIDVSAGVAKKLGLTVRVYWCQLL